MVKDPLETCFNAPHLFLLRSQIKAFHAEVYEGRWGAILHVVSCLLPLEDALRRGLSLPRFMAVSGANVDRGDGHGLKVEVADAAIPSDYWWEYSREIDTVSEVLQELQRWAESCPCHYRPIPLEGHSRHRRGREVQRMIGYFQCPCASLQALAFVTGKAFSMLERLLNMGNAMVLLHCSRVALLHGERVKVMQDFAEAQRHIHLCFRLKLRYWRQLPWVLCGIGHWEEQQARRCCIEALQLYAHSPPRVEHHPLSMLLCAPGTIGFHQVTLFANGVCTREELPYLHGLLRVSGSYRWQRGGSKVYTHAARNNSVCRVALVLDILGFFRHPHGAGGAAEGGQEFIRCVCELMQSGQEPD